MRVDRDMERFVVALTAVAEMYGKSLSEAVLQLWWQVLEGYDIERVESALLASIRNPEGGQFMPRPADLIKVLDGTQSENALIAWGKALAAAERAGSYRSVTFDDPAIHVAIMDMGGWAQFCRARLDELPFLQKRFCDLHRAATRPGQATPMISHLPGASELENRLLGRAVESPVLIGDASKARFVLENGTRERTPLSVAALQPAALGLARPL